MFRLASPSPSPRRDDAIARWGIPAGLAAAAAGTVALASFDLVAAGVLLVATIVAGVTAPRLRHAARADIDAADRANVEALQAARARALAAADEERRRVVRDLHDGAQQRLVHTVIMLKLAQRALGDRAADAATLVAEALEQAEQATVQLRELARGTMPRILSSGGLSPAVRELAERSPFSVAVDVPDRRLPTAIEAAAYFVVAEALTNVTKHARAHVARVKASVADGVLHVEVRDDGIGGADPDGNGLLGLRDRVTALGGTLDVSSPPGGGTRLAAALPIPTPDASIAVRPERVAKVPVG
jgi:signal transduction histidine kinase